MNGLWEWELDVENEAGEQITLQLIAQYVLEVEGRNYSLRDLKIRGADKRWDNEAHWDFYNIQLQRIMDLYEAEEAQSGRE